jgi:hypothetical protein
VTDRVRRWSGNDAGSDGDAAEGGGWRDWSLPWW